ELLPEPIGELVADDHVARYLLGVLEHILLKIVIDVGAGVAFGLVHLSLIESCFPSRLLVMLQAVAATVGLGSPDVGKLAELGIELGPAQSPVERDEALE